MEAGFRRRFRPLELLTEEQVAAIHRGALDVLQETGVLVEHERALELLEQNGCPVDHDARRARFPPGLVEECVRKCPSSFRLKSRDPDKDIVMGGDTVYFMPFPGLQALDTATWEPRLATRGEYYDVLRILDALDNVHSLMNYTPYQTYADVPTAMQVPEGVAARLRTFSKNILQAGRAPGTQVFVNNMAKTLGIDIGGGLRCHPPLSFPRMQVDAAWRLAEEGFGTMAETVPVFGSTGPATVAGSLVSGTAEALATIVLMQLIRPGSRVWLLHFAHPQNAGGDSRAFGSVGSSLSRVMCCQMWRHYGVPTFINSGGPSSSKRIDFQCGYEKGIGALLAALAGANIIALQGGVYGAETFHPLQAILDDDIAGMIGRFIEGVEVTDETLAIDLINAIGPSPGSYLESPHTHKWRQLEEYVPEVADTLSYQQWEERGRKSALDYAGERMEQILASHRPMPLTSGQEQAIEDILNDARAYYRREGMISDDEWTAYQTMLAEN
jgi:trimethylamine--corrinoid protein Co-methyltransferase